MEQVNWDIEIKIACLLDIGQIFFQVCMKSENFIHDMQHVKYVSVSVCVSFRSVQVDRQPGRRCTGCDQAESPEDSLKKKKKEEC